MNFEPPDPAVFSTISNGRNRYMFLGIEIGGTKLQLGVGTGSGLEFVDFRRLPVDPRRGAAGIRDQIALVGRELIHKHDVRGIGIGFGGPVDAARGITTKSHQIDGWEDFPFGEWCRRELGLEAVLGNDCDVATLAEARYGAGQGKKSVFYVTVGTGVGGGCVIDGQLLGRGRPAIAEIGHLRPGLQATDSHSTVESIASGWGIATTARQLLREETVDTNADAQQLLHACQQDLEQLTAVMIADLARQGNSIAWRALDRAVMTLGWAIAQVITLIAPEAIVIGGGVSFIGEQLFFHPLRNYVARYTFPPLANAYQIVPATLGEKVVVYGAIALAADSGSGRDCRDWEDLGCKLQ
jgi:glucokinase